MRRPTPDLARALEARLIKIAAGRLAVWARRTLALYEGANNDVLARLKWALEEYDEVMADLVRDEEYRAAIRERLERKPLRKRSWVLAINRKNRSERAERRAMRQLRAQARELDHVAPGSLPARGRGRSGEGSVHSLVSVQDALADNLPA